MKSGTFGEPYVATSPGLRGRASLELGAGGALSSSSGGNGSLESQLIPPEKTFLGMFLSSMLSGRRFSSSQEYVEVTNRVCI